jgi:spore coat protein U-like protein
MNASCSGRLLLLPRLGLLAAATLTWSGALWAATCNLSFGSLGFGAYVSAQISSSSTATLNCTKPPGPPEDINYTIALSTGAGTYAQRLMNRSSLPADTLPYNLYLNALPAVLNTSVWGDGSGTTVRWTGSIRLTGNANVTRTATLVGAIPAGFFPAAGTYQDTIVATLTIN